MLIAQIYKCICITYYNFINVSSEMLDTLVYIKNGHIYGDDED